MLNEKAVEYFAARVKQLRLQKNLSQEALASETGFHRTYIGMVERGERNISLNHIAVFAKVFELNLSDFLDFSSINPNHSRLP
jgi:transcriptional regulator with XRE-family HTH domain